MYPTISTNFSLNFTAGLNKKLSAKCLFFESRDLERKLSLYENIDANFKGNKPIAFCLSQIYDIFNQLNIKILKFTFPRFRVFNQSQLAINFKNTAFCLPETQLILKDDLPFETGSIFQKEIDNIEHLNALIEKEPARITDEPVKIYVNEFQASSIDIGIRYWVKTEDYWESRWRVLEEIKEEFDNNNIAIPFEQLDVNLIPQEKE